MMRLRLIDVGVTAVAVLLADYGIDVMASGLPNDCKAGGAALLIEAGGINTAVLFNLRGAAVCKQETGRQHKRGKKHPQCRRQRHDIVLLGPAPRLGVGIMGGHNEVGATVWPRRDHGMISSGG